jgi:CRISPR-associated protein Cmr4
MVMGEAALLFCYAETPVHAGGPDSVGVVDLPIQREATTRLPTVWGQSAKGALRDHARTGMPPWPDVAAVFGSAPPGSTDAGTDPPSPGWLAVGDLRLVAFPVPTLTRTFAWVTSPLLLARMARMADLGGVAWLPQVPSVQAGQVVPVSDGWGAPGARLAVGEHDLKIREPDELLAEWARWLAANALPGPPPTGAAGTADADGRNGRKRGAGSDPFEFFRTKLRSDLLLVGDDDLAALTEEHVELLPRVQLKAKAKTVQHGPWYTEYLPAETLLCSLLRDCLPPEPGGSRPRLDVLGERLDGELLVAGGDETLGKGLLWLHWRGRDRGGDI